MTQMLIVDCSKPIGQQETLVDMTVDQISEMNDSCTAAIVLMNQQIAKELLDKSDITILRCYENQITVPTEWTAYRVSLRSIIVSGQGDLPTQPSYPQGT